MYFIYEVVTDNGAYYYDSIEELESDFPIKGWTEDGGSTREELWEQPKLWDALGPMYGGLRDGIPVIRYESQKVYNQLSQ